MGLLEGFQRNRQLRMIENSTNNRHHPVKNNQNSTDIHSFSLSLSLSLFSFLYILADANTFAVVVSRSIFLSIFSSSFFDHMGRY